MSHSFGPRIPYSARNRAKAARKATTSSSVAPGSADATPAAPSASNSPVRPAEARTLRERSQSAHDGDADSTSPRPEIRSSRASGRPARAASGPSIAGPTVEASEA